MNLLFSSLLCHRDVELFKFNWFSMRANLDHGFDIKHLILNDGSLTPQDKEILSCLPGVILDEEPITIYEAPKPVFLAKLECLKRGFEKYSADRVIVFDCDIFFLRSWESDLRKMLQERTTVLRDWGSSIGPNVQQYYDLFGVREDLITPNCNTGVISVLKEDYAKISEKLRLHLKTPFLILEDQGIMLAAFHGHLSYCNNIMCLITGIETHSKMWDFALKTSSAVHLMGMRTRPIALHQLVQITLENLPTSIHLSQITPTYKFISWGLMEYGHYNFSVPLQKLPTTSKGEYIYDALYLHGGSQVQWKLPPQFNKFTTKLICMDTGIPSNVHDTSINGKKFDLNSEISVDLNGQLEILTENGPGTHLAFLEPRLHINKLWPDLSLQKV